MNSNINAVISENYFDKKRIIHLGNQFITGNLYIGVRGFLDEFRASEMASINLPLLYDKVDNKWRESVNSPNPLYFSIEVDEKKLSVLNSDHNSHLQELNLFTGLMTRKTNFNCGVTLKSSRFVSDSDPKLIVSKYEITSLIDKHISIKTGIDTIIYDINGPHLTSFSYQNINNVLYCSAETNEKGTLVSIFEMIDYDFEATEKIIEEDGVYRKISFNAKSNKTYILYKYSRISYDEIGDTQSMCNYKSMGYDQLFEEHRRDFTKRWKIANVEIEGNDEADLALRYSIYQLLIISPWLRDSSSIPARGISGQTYKGAVFWDTEMFMLPFYLNTDLRSAKSIINYRIDGIVGARQKAKELGYKGAFYAWESQEKGYEACTDYNVIDVFTKRPIRTYFRDKQIHINADIVYAFWEYYKRTNDLNMLKKMFPVIIETAIFYYDYSYINPTRQKYEFLDVLGPDEYHERVNNNAFTNRMIKNHFEILKETKEIIKNNYQEYHDKIIQQYSTVQIDNIIKSIDEIYIKETNQDGIIEQYDGYFKLEDISIVELMKRKINPNEYLGGNGLAGETTIIKQADVITMLYLFKEFYTEEIMKSNFDYYEPRTEHGSSLSASMYALVACLMNNPDYAYPHFIKSATIDLTGKSKQFAGDIYIGGTHPAASGGAYMTALYGFAKLQHFTDKISVKANLPQNIKSIKFKVMNNNKLYKVIVNKVKTYIEEVAND